MKGLRAERRGRGAGALPRSRLSPSRAGEGGRRVAGTLRCARGALDAFAAARNTAPNRPSPRRRRAFFPRPAPGTDAQQLHSFSSVVGEALALARQTPARGGDG